MNEENVRRLIEAVGLKLSRRQFHLLMASLGLSAPLASQLLSWPGIATAQTGAAENPLSPDRQRLRVVGIRPEQSSIGPAGNHLRWSFPTEFGFPDQKGFQVFRRLSSPFERLHCVDLSQHSVPANSVIESGSSLQGVTFSYSSDAKLHGNGVNLTVKAPRPALLELRFAAPIVNVRITLRGIKTPQLQLRAYSDGDLVATTEAAGGSDSFLEVTAPNITRVTLPLLFELLAELCYLTMEAACDDKSWQRRIDLPLLLSVDVSQALSRLENNLRNFYATSRTAAVEKYQRTLPSLINWLALVHSETNGSTVPPAQIEVHSDDPQGPIESIRPLPILLLAALDPNIARFLSLYWVDRDDASDGAKPDVLYDYKVTARWPNEVIRCGLVLQVGAKPSPQPTVSRPLLGSQLRGLRVSGQDLKGRVGLSWPIPPSGQGAVQPVLFDLQRRSESGSTMRLTESKPVLVPLSAWTDKTTPLFTDADAPLEPCHYELRGIDLFGQLGRPVSSGTVRIQDLNAPPPPIRLRSTLRQPGHPWRKEEDRNRATTSASLRLQFEYGDAQNRQAPDAKEFQIYWRAESLFVSRSVHAELSTTSQTTGGAVYAVRIPSNDADVTDLSAFVGGRMSRESGEPTLPATDRHHYQVAKKLSANELELAPSEHQFSNGEYRLISDPHARDNWNRLKVTVPVRPPQNVVVLTQGALKTIAKSVQNFPSSASPLALFPPHHRPANSAPPPVVEIELDFVLLEGNTFAGGTVKSGDAQASILYSTGDATANGRIGIAAGTTINSGAPLELRPPKGAKPVVVLLIEGELPKDVAHSLGGEVAIDVDRSDGQRTYVARSLSLFVREGSGRSQVLVRISSEAVSAIHEGKRRARYYAPYGIDLTVNHSAGGAAGPSTIGMPFAAGQSRQSLYLAVTTRNEGGNEGPLSAPSQATLVRPPPSGSPGRPYPCGSSAASEVGYATPPDARGRATICLAWDSGDLSPSDDVRYEVARTMDSTIVEAHRRRWTLGQAPLEHVLAAPVVNGVLSEIHFLPERGLYLAKLATNLGELAVSDFVSGRLVQPPPSATQPDKDAAHFQVTRIERTEGGPIELLLRPVRQETPQATEVRLEAPPNYDRIRSDTAVLSALANEMDDAFGVATGMPISTTRFVDEIPGFGRNRFFYRVRAVDSAESRSRWSDLSAPFFQVDTRPPAAPALVTVLGLEKRAVLAFSPPADPAVVGFALYAAAEGPRPATALEERFIADADGERLAPRRLRITNGLLSLTEIDLAIVEQIASVNDIHGLNDDGSVDAMRNLTAGATLDRNKRTIEWAAGAPSHGTAARVSYLDSAGREQTLDRVPGQYEFVYRLNGLGDARQKRMFWLQSIKRVRRREGTPLTIRSSPSEPTEASLLDSELPPAPNWLELRWHDGGQRPAVLRWQSAWPDATYTLQRKVSFAREWQTVQQLTAPTGAVQVEDPDADPAFTYHYRLKVRVHEKDNESFAIGILPSAKA